MDTVDSAPQTVIARMLYDSPEQCGDIVVELLQLLADSLGNIIGTAGFDVLFNRALRRVAKKFPWVVIEPHSGASDPEFEAVRLCLIDRKAWEIQAASLLLFRTLIEIMTFLLGAHLTTMIFTSTFGQVRSGRQPQGETSWKSE